MTDIPPPAPPDGAPDWAAVQSEVVEHLQRLIRIVTVNPPGNELAAARYLDGVLTAAGIESRVLEPAPGRGAVVARLRGTGERAPVLLLAHTDVVGVEAAQWSVEPFGGVVRDGYVYGRGAIDDKGMLAANLVTMLLLRRHVAAGGTLRRDVVLVANADEEAGGELGMAWLLAHHPELVRAEFALNEGGRTRVVRGRPLYVAVQTAEKVPHVVTVTARGDGGHASVPLPGNPVFRLGRALAAIGGWRAPTAVTPTTRRFFAELARVWPERAEARAMADVAASDPARVRRGAAALRRVPTFDALLRAGVSAVMTRGGIRTNVIPTEATATLDVRTLPGQSIDALVARLRRVVDDPRVEIAVAERGRDAPSSDHASPMFRAIAEAARALDPRLVTVPYLSTGATDSAQLRAWGVPTFGVLPFPLTQDDEDRMHGHDERVPVEALLFGTRLIYEAVRRVAVA
ncbi:M20/M25/M40 family metallo-hydrolase [Roseisolibacter sp. H3M3-2]|uniref:M20/M25/M40 family metallo-hydrolase n=1 Tax=Roseisolibacter sp. H3M3-2 TaxID=3031323 RepID=UPI0023DC72D0|nr:M20/M25/M40 family metallo-hydrolase [Roseisolibacter sp. H3M3-2]MDF1502158.1 M20/M25/M40 family metallo-hydrolase [Roseisolibacter sp. H3M3-2]